jgi:hypothetical protein
MSAMKLIVVGGGISGILAAYRISQHSPETKIDILESSNSLGGRLLFNSFYGVDVPLGGSIIRNEDSRVLNLCQEMGLGIKSFISDLKSIQHTWVNNFIDQLKIKIISSPIKSSESVYEYLVRNFPPQEVDWFIQNSIYRDYVDGNMNQFVKNYPLKDLYQPESRGKPMHYVVGGYGKLFNQIVKRIQGNPHVHIHLNTHVQEVSQSSSEVHLQTNVGKFVAQRVIWATGHQAYSALPSSLQKSLEHVIGIPFIRVYGYSKVEQPDFPELVTSGIIGKCFPKNSHVFQIAYTEGDWAVRLAAMLAGKTKKEQVELMIQLFRQGTGRSIPLDDLVYQYWSSGIHQYMSDKDGIVHEGNITVIGEAVSTNQGWVEGCLETVESLMEKNI